jgi:FMN-dependent NADH-azoreductase
MTKLLHIGASPRGGASESLAIASTFVDAYRSAHPAAQIETWDLWDGTLPAFGPPAAGAKMTVFGGGTPEGPEAAAWDAARAAFARFDAADHLLFSVPMWNGGIPYVLKQFIDVVSQPGLVFGVDPVAGYTGLLAGRGKKVAVIYTSAVWGPGLGPEFGRDFHASYFDDWLRWAGIDDITAVRMHPTLTGDADAHRERAHADARRVALTFGAQALTPTRSVSRFSDERLPAGSVADTRTT